MPMTTLEEVLRSSKYAEVVRQVLDIFVPLALRLPQLRDNPAAMLEKVKAIGRSGITDVATNADIFIQDELRKQVEGLHDDWQFWGEEAADNAVVYDATKRYLFITDPIEGTNNFKAKKDEQWGSVVALVDIATKQPVIGIIALPAQRRFYLGIKGTGAYIVVYGEHGRPSSFTRMASEPEQAEFTYNNSPHFESRLVSQVQKFMAMGKVQPSARFADALEKSRKKIIMPDGSVFIDPESGALEVVRNRGTIYFKTGNEMAAVVPILEELGGKVTDAYGTMWHLGISTLIAARTKADYLYLRSIYERTI